jgi:hypothetical protein
MRIGEVLLFWALVFAAAYGVLTFLGHLGLLYGTPIVGQKICAREPTIDKDARGKRGSLVPPIPGRAKA